MVTKVTYDHVVGGGSPTVCDQNNVTKNLSIVMEISAILLLLVVVVVLLLLLLLILHYLLDIPRVYGILLTINSGNVDKRYLFKGANN